MQSPMIWNSLKQKTNQLFAADGANLEGRWNVYLSNPGVVFGVTALRAFGFLQIRSSLFQDIAKQLFFHKRKL